jgi:hypothetical protein
MSIAKLLSAGLLSVGIIVGGAVVRASAAPVPESDKKDDQKKEDKGSGDKKPDNPFGPAFDDLFKQLGGRGDMTPEQVERLRKQLEKAFDQMDKQFFPGGGLPNPGPGGGLLPGFPIVPFPGGRLGDRPAMRENSRLGARLEKPSDTLIDQLDLPRGQGQVVEQLNDDSPAAKAGLKAHDILLELDGKPVSSDTREFAKQLGDIKSDKPVDAVVLRKGKKETVKNLALPEDQKPERRPGTRLPLRGLPNGVLPVVPEGSGSGSKKID